MASVILTFTLEIPPNHVAIMGYYAEVTIVLNWNKGTVHGTKFPQKYTCLIIGYFVCYWVQPSTVR